MKITKNYLKQVISEELQKLQEAEKYKILSIKPESDGSATFTFRVGSGKVMINYPKGGAGSPLINDDDDVLEKMGYRSDDVVRDLIRIAQDELGIKRF